MSNFYISDLHFDHGKVISFDGRPFADLDEMHTQLISNWNSAVTDDDTVYILGDFIGSDEKEWPRILERLNGSKVLIRGNHDPAELSGQTKRFFLDIRDYMEIMDGDRFVILCHYPVPFHNLDHDEKAWMLYGHVHARTEYGYIKQIRARIIEARKERGDPLGQFVNVGCMMPWMDYTPRTLDEIIANEKAYRTEVMK